MLQRAQIFSEHAAPEDGRTPSKIARSLRTILKIAVQTALSISMGPIRRAPRKFLVLVLVIENGQIAQLDGTKARDQG
jgi:hypothetical protein